MADYQSHISFSSVVGVGYTIFGMVFLGVHPEQALLALAIIIVAGILPDLDAKSGAPVRELSALLAAWTRGRSDCTLRGLLGLRVAAAWAHLCGGAHLTLPGIIGVVFGLCAPSLNPFLSSPSHLSRC